MATNGVLVIHINNAACRQMIRCVMNTTGANVIHLKCGVKTTGANVIHLQCRVKTTGANVIHLQCRVKTTCWAYGCIT